MRLKPEQAAGHTCQWFDAQPDPRDEAAFECGDPAEHKVKVHGAVTKAFVYLCEYHKTQVNEHFASLRVNEQTKAG